MLLAYDLGTGGAKASLYENDGTLLAASFESYSTYYPQSGWHEQRPEDWRLAIIASTKKLLAETKADPNQVEAIALSGHSLGCVPLDKSGKLLLESTPIWSDSRAGDQAESYFKTNDYASWYRKTGAGFPPGLYTIFKLLWYKEHLPDMFEQMDKFIGTKDYVNFWLTGVAATDYSYASGCGGYSLTDWNYSEEIIESAGLPRSIFPELYPSTGVLGTLTAQAAAELGLPQTVKVCAGGVDNSCMALGAKAYTDGRSYASLGSSSWIAVSSSQPLLDDKFLPYVFAHVVPGQFASATAIFSAGTTLRWIRDNFCQDIIAKAEQTGQNAYALMMDEADKGSEIGARGLLLNPTFAGGSSLEPSSAMRGGLFNIDLSATRADVIRAALEGVALNLRKAFDALDSILVKDAQSAASAQATLLVGGGAISPIWRRIYCDAWNRPVEKTNIDQDAAALGAAAIAAVGTGLWSDFSRLDEIHQTQEILTPIPENVEKYNQILPKFLQTADMLTELVNA